MSNTSVWQILIVDDDETICKEVKEYLEGEADDDLGGRFHVETLTEFDEALKILEARRIDLLILDVRLGPLNVEHEEDKGIETLRAIKQRCFVPIIFYTGLPHLVDDLVVTPSIVVLDKTSKLAQLMAEVRAILDTRLPRINRALIKHLETVQRDYMWTFVTTHWEQLSSNQDQTALAYLLARRFAMSLSGSGIQDFIRDLGGKENAAVASDTIHSTQYYIIPPLETDSPSAGDIYLGQVGDITGFWILLTPSCDLVANRKKVDKVLLARCTSLAEQREYQEWLASPSNSHAEQLRSLMKNRRTKQEDRFHFLPGALILPDQVVDFQSLVTVPPEDLKRLNRLASLDSPFAEAAVARFTRYYGRLGTPDLDLDSKLTELAPPQTTKAK